MSFELPASPNQLVTQNLASNPGDDIGWRAKLGRAMAAAALIVGTSVAAYGAEATVSPSVAHADTLGYPWADASYVDANYDWGYSTCPTNDASCMTPFSGYLGGVKYGETDPWKYYLRNCTSYEAWKEISVGVSPNAVMSLGNGGDWYKNAPANEKSLTPRAWDAAVEPGTKSNPAGHLAFVESVNSDGTITVSEYNHDKQGNGDMRTGTPASLGFTEFVDFGVHPPSVSTAPPPPDADKDTVPDAQDWCPIVAGNPTNNGCPSDVIQVSGDVDGDGKKDIVAISRNPDDSPSISWLKSTSSGASASLADAQSAGVSLPAPAWNTSHLKWATGDFNGDGKDDLLAVSGSATDSPVLYEFLSNGSGFNTPQIVYQPNPTYWKWQNLEFMTGDINGDGKADIIDISRNPDNTPTIGWFQSTSTGMTAAVADPVGLQAPGAGWNVDHLKWTVGDFNGDHKADIFAMSGSQTDAPTMYIFQSNGASLAAPALVKAPNPAYWQWPRLQIMAGDINGDGKSDVIYISRNPDNSPTIGYLQSTSTAAVPSLADGVGLQAPSSGWTTSHLKWASEDVNGDGTSDVVGVSGSDTDAPVIYEFLASSSGLGVPQLVKQLSLPGWQWLRLQF